MELHQLRYFVTVVREGTFTRAAERLYITQPSLSEQIRKLEGEVGSPLFERLGRSLALTSAGEALLPHAERVLFEVEQARLHIQQVQGLQRGRLTICVLPSVGARLLPRFLAEFRRHHPGIEVALREESVTAAAEEAVHQGEVDLAILRMPVRRADLGQRTLMHEPMVLVVSPGHQLAGRRSVSMTELAGEPFVTMKPGYGLRETLEAICESAGFQPKVVFETGQIGSVLGLVHAGMGITVLPEMALNAEARSVAIRDAFARRELGVVWRQGQPLAPAASAFLDMLRRAAESFSR